jgi:hypothetical protein
MPYNFNMKMLDSFSTDCEPAVRRTASTLQMLAQWTFHDSPPFHRDTKYMHRECKSEAVK